MKTLPGKVPPAGEVLAGPASPHPVIPGRRPCSLVPPALQRLRGWDDVAEDIEEIRQEDQAEKVAGSMSVWALFGLRALRWQLISIVVLMGGQQLSGVNAVRGRPRCPRVWDSPLPSPEPSASPGHCFSRSTTMQTRST